MKKAFIKTIKVLVFIGGFIAVERFCHKKTEGFMFNKILSNLSYDERWETPRFPIDKEKEILSITDQPFYYLKSGGQSYAFISEDGKTVLKFFKMHHMREIKWLTKARFPSFIDIGRDKIVTFRNNKLNHIFGSCAIASQEMQDETGMIYCHLNKTRHLKKKVVIYDKIGIRHVVNLDETPFVLQKKADLVFAKFHQVMANKDLTKAQECIDSLLNLFVTRYEKGIDDNDPIIRKNFGFLGTKAIEIDLGSFSRKEDLKDPSLYKLQLKKEMVDFKKWIEEFYPTLTPYLEERMNVLASESV